MQALRGVFRAPMGLFDEYRALGFKHPRKFNYYMFYMAGMLIMFAGKGVEKITVQGPHNSI